MQTEPKIYFYKIISTKTDARKTLKLKYIKRPFGQKSLLTLLSNNLFKKMISSSLSFQPGLATYHLFSCYYTL